MPEPEPSTRVNLGDFDPTIIGRALNQITETISRHFETRTRSILFGSLHEGSLEKCKECVWFNKKVKFCAVAPENLTTFDCQERKVPEQPTNLDYMEARSPERIALLQDLAKNLKTDVAILEQKLYRAWAKHHERFGLTTCELLVDIEKLGSYSISQMELIGDGIRLNMDDMASCLIAAAIRRRILTGCSFDDVMIWLFSASN